MQTSLNSADLPRTHKGVVWSEVFAGAQPGHKLHLVCETAAEAVIMRQCVLRSTKILGLPSTSAVHGTVILVSILDRKARQQHKFSNHTDIAAAVARHNNLTARIREADDNTAYWLRQIALRTLPEAKTQARGIYAAWKMTAARLREEHDSRSLAAA